MAFHERSDPENSYSILEATQWGQVDCLREFKFFKEKFNRGTTFTIEGSMYDYVRVSCIHHGEKVYWTWSKPPKFKVESKDIQLQSLRSPSSCFKPRIST